MELPPFLLERFFDRFEFNVPHLLAASDCETFSVAELLQDNPDELDRLLKFRLGYTETRGHPELRRLISTLYQSQSPETILVCAGAEEAIFLAFNAALEPGDHVIVHHPCYQSLHEIPRAIGCEVSFLKTHQENGWAFDFDALEKSIKPNTRMLVINSPHNPTGFHLSPTDLARLKAIALKNRLRIFSDEVYRFLEYDEKNLLPAIADDYAKGLSLGVMSKSFGLAGLRIGWIATHDAEWLERIASLKDYTTICNSAPSEYLAIVAIRRRDQLIARNRSIVLDNLSLLREFMHKFNDRLAWIEPRGGCVAFPWFHSENIGDDFYERMATEYGILLLPGSCFDFPTKFFRIGFGRKNFREGLERLAEVLGKKLNRGEASC